MNFRYGRYDDWLRGGWILAGIDNSCIGDGYGPGIE